MKILIVGCGSIGRRHATNAAKLAQTAVVDADPQVAADCARELNVRFFPDLESGLAWRPDGLIIATPTHLHAPVALKAIESVNHILIEKPISLSTKQAGNLLKRSEKAGCHIHVVCNMRFHPGVKTIYENLSRVGSPLFARAHFGNYLPNMRPHSDYRHLYCAKREQGGGVLLDGIHEIDYLIWFFGSVRERTTYADKISQLDIDTEDYACLCLRHNCGTVSEIHIDYLRPFKRRGCEVVGDEGMLLWQSEGKKPETCRVRFYANASGSWHDLYVSKDLDINAPYEALVLEFINTIEGRGAPLLSGVDAAYELMVLEGAIKKGYARLESIR